MFPRATLLVLLMAAVPGSARAQSPAADAGTAAPAAPPPDAPNVLHLDEAVQTAIKNQPQLIQARANASAAEGRVIQARSPLLPQVTPQVSWTRSYRALTSATTGGTGTTSNVAQCVSSTCNTWRFGVAGSQTLWDPSTWAGWESQQRSADSLNATAAATLNNVILNVRTYYFLARATRDLVWVADQTLKNQVTHQQQVEGFVRVGTRPEIDLALARLNVANARVQLINAQNNDHIAKAQLNQAMGLPQGTDYQVAGDELPPVDVEDRPLPFLFDQALSSRPEIASFEYARQASGKTLDSARWGWSPTIGFSGSYFKAGPELSALADSWAFGFTLSWSLVQGGLTVGRVREAEQNLVSSTAALTGEQLQVRFDVEQAEATLLGNKESVVAAQDAVDNGKEQLRLAEGRYQAGVGTIIELSDAQVQLTNAAAQLVQAQYNLATARARLLAALGRQE
ncbi:MAG TPA: TolC family protein [Myxococcaceae bacterium]|nr:TolC family protein [Myxococcaceae bacterium]